MFLPPFFHQNNAGTDASGEFDEVFHSAAAKKQLDDYQIGYLKGYDPKANKSS